MTKPWDHPSYYAPEEEQPPGSCPDCWGDHNTPWTECDNAQEDLQMSKTLAEEVEEAANGQPILACVIGVYGWKDYRPCPVPNQDMGRILSWKQARPQLDYEYHGGHGAPECNAFYAWTEDRVIFVHEYDGATCVVWVPRNPMACDPGMGGETGD